MSDVTTIDCHYIGEPHFAAAYLLREGDRASFVETNSVHAVPRLLETLSAAGLTPQQVDYVIVTHAHLDHAGGAGTLMQACPNATLLAHPKAHPHLVDPSKLVASARGVYGDARFAELYGNIVPIPEARTRILSDGETLTWGSRRLRFLHTRGHANHHFCIHDKETQSIFTGDAFGLVYPALQHKGLLAIPSTSPTDFDASAARDSLQRILETGAATAYLTHYGPQTALTAIAAQLDEQLVEYGAVVDDALREDIPDDALDAYCARRVRTIFDSVLGELGLADDSAAQKLLAVDIDLNGQGIAFAVRKARFKAGR